VTQSTDEEEEEQEEVEGQKTIKGKQGEDANVQTA
jgi:hypothetical protein